MTGFRIGMLLVAALIVMLRFFPYFDYVFGDGFGVYVNDTSNWLMNVPNMAAQRAMVIGMVGQKRTLLTILPTGRGSICF